MIRAARLIGLGLALAVAGTAVGVQQSLEEVVATRLARTAVMQTRLIASPTLDEYKMTALALGEALELDPGNHELLRLQIEAWNAAQETEEALAATHRLVRLDPSDTVAQLRAISATLSGLQRIEDRIAHYDRLLGEAGARVNDSVRSRLAFDAALLHRELGDEDAYLRLLRTSLSLDQTNKQAALLASTMFLSQVDDPAGRCEMHVQLLLADPLDAESHLALARELQSHGAYAGAQRFMTNAATLRAKRSVAMNDELLNMYYAVTWGKDGAEPLLARLEEEEAARRYSVDAQRRAATKSGEDPEQIPDASVHPVEDRLRVLMAGSLGRTDEATAFYDRYRAAIAASFQAAIEDGIVDQTQTQQLGERIILDAVRVRAWSGADLAHAERELETLTEIGSGTVRADAVDRYRGLIAAHRGDRATAERLLTPLAGSDPLVTLGLAIAAEKSGDVRTGAARYATVLRDAPGSVEGLWARERLEQILGSRVNPSATAARLNAIASEAPAALERYIEDPKEYLSLSVEVGADALDPMTPMRARVRLHNGGVFPLGIGPGAPIEARVLVAPKLNMRGAPVLTMISPEFTSLARKLRLMPGESVVAEVLLELSGLGTMVESTSPLAASLRCQAIQAYIHTEERGLYKTAPYGLEASSAVVWRRPQRTSPEFADILERVTSLSGDEFYGALHEAQWFFLMNTPEDDDGTLSEQRRELADAVAARFPTMSEMEQAFTLLSAPGAWQIPETEAIDEAARGVEPRPLVTLVMLLTRVADAGDPTLEVGLQHDDPVVREIAEIKALRFRVIEGMNRINSVDATPSEPAPSR